MKPQDVIRSIRYFGAGTIVRGLWHRFIRKSGLLKRRFPLQRWTELSLSSFVQSDMKIDKLRGSLAQASFFPVTPAPRDKKLLARIMGADTETVVEAADNIVAGKFRFFSDTTVELGRPVPWHHNPFTHAQWPRDVHWCDLDYFVPQRGDVKLVWEISRFGWAYDLVRAYVLTDDEKYVRGFWELTESWLEENQPNRGVNWASGQECGLRVMAWCFAMFAFLDARATTDRRIEKLLVALARHGERIEGFIAHAVRQKTNHAITEATALYTLGTVLGFYKNSTRWRTLGKRVLEREGLRQIYEDGSYVQQSMNYHRLMLHGYLWSLRLAQLNQDEFSDGLCRRLVKATKFLYEMQDSQSHRLPNYGGNDGAMILPLNTCDHLDYRPIVQSCWFLLQQNRLYETGPWDEDLFWLFGSDSRNAEKTDRQQVSTLFPMGGYASIRAADSWAMVRCHKYRDRVGHVDMMHLDLWAEGVNLLRDCGTYKYFAPDETELEKYFKSIWAHNTVIVDNSSPLRLISRFMWVPWPRAGAVQFDVGDGHVQWKGRSLAYDRPPWHVTHTRKVTAKIPQNQWQITDELHGRGKRELELRWHLPEQARLTDSDNHSVQLHLSSKWRLKVKTQTEMKARLLTACNEGGWESLYYNRKKPIVTLAVAVDGELPVMFDTVVWKESTL